MALQLPSGNGSSYLEGSFTGVTGYPFTFYCRAQTQSSTEDDCAFMMGGSSADDDAHALYFRGDLTGDPVQLRRTGPGGAGIGINSAAGYTPNTWVDLCGVMAAANDAKLFADNVKTTNTTSVGFVNGNVVIGVYRFLGSSTSFLSGKVSNCAVWDVALTDDEVASLFKGFPPRRIRPQALKFYAPLVRQFIDFKGGVSLSPNGSPTAGIHPRSYGF